MPLRAFTKLRLLQQLHILRASHQFQVRWVHTWRIVAGVMYLHFIGDRALEQPIRNPVRTGTALPLETGSALSVAAGRFALLPLPTAILGYLELLQEIEVLAKWNFDRHSSLHALLYRVKTPESFLRRTEPGSRYTSRSVDPPGG